MGKTGDFGVAIAVLTGWAILFSCGGCSRPSTQAAAAAPTAKPAIASPDQPAATRGRATGTNGMAAIAKAAQRDKYLFAFFFKGDDESTRAMRQVFDTTMAKLTDRADAVAIDVADSAEKEIVAKFELDRAPLPLVLALAPNGAITGGFPQKFTEEELQAGFATPCTEKCMKALQDSRLVLVCVQNATTKSNDTAMQGVREFQDDAKYREFTEIVMLDPADGKEASFLKDLDIAPTASEAVTVLLVPPGSVVAEFTGPTQKAALVAALEKAASGACSGGTCGPGGCGPSAKP